MSNEQNTRTLIEDLPVTEQELTETEMENVQGGRIRPGVPEATPSPSSVAPSTNPEAGLSGSVSNYKK